MKSISPLINGTSPVYNQSVEFNVPHSIESFRISINHQSGELLGSSDISIIDMVHSDSGKKQLKVSFKSEEGAVLDGYLSCSATLIKSYYSIEIKNKELTESNMNELETQREQWMKYISSLSHPFPSLVTEKDK